MTIELNHDHHPEARRTGGTDAHVMEPSLYGAITGQVAVGRYVLQVGEPYGARVHEAARTERSHIRPRRTPVLLRPRQIHGLIDRQVEVAAILSALEAALPVEVSGGAGIGKTALLRHLAHHPRAASYPDGIVYLSARHHASADLQQLLFEAFHESTAICKPTDSEIRGGLQDKQALILLDDVQLPSQELEQVLDVAPRSAFIVATRERRLWGEARSLAPTGLPVEDAVLLLERELERSLDVAERSAAATLCAALGGHPVRLQQAAAIAREQGISLDVCARSLTPASLVSELMPSIDEKQLRALLALAALPGVPLRVQDISGIADITDVEPSLVLLGRRGVCVCSDSRHRLAAGIGDRLRRKEDLTPWVNRVITYFTAWSERYRRSPDRLLEESEALLRVQQIAVEARRHGEALRIGRLLEGALMVGARWGAWAIVLEHCLAAAKAIGDRSAEAWALHEIGTRALCLGEPGAARTSLSQAATLRDAIGEHDAAAASRTNLGFVLAPEPVVVRERTSIRFGDRLDLDSLPLRGEIQPAFHAPTTTRVGALPLVVLLAAICGALAYWAASGAGSWRSWNAAGLSSFLQGGLRAATQPMQEAAVVSVRRFSSVPDRTDAGGSVRLCYEVANGTRVRIDPEIGDVAAVGQDCISAAPRETTTYRLTAEGADGTTVSETVLVPVGATPKHVDPEERGAIGSGSELQARPAEPQLPLSEPATPGSDRANILIFTPRPGSITAGGPTKLCYAVSGALQAHVEPGIGDVTPASTLTCLRVAPRRTTTYELSARGRDGHQVTQHLVIVVR
jgi:NB-ARC domain-containing protein